MNDLIRRSEAIDAIMPLIVAYKSVVKRILMQLPSAEPEIIRCKDCKYIEEHYYENAGDAPYIKYTCKHKDGLADGYQVHDWDFCSRAEKKEDE